MAELDNAEKREPSPSSASSELEASHGITEKHLMRKLDRHLLPGVCILYLLSFLDRSNVANAKLDGLTTSLGISGNEYLTGLTLFFVGYIIFEVIWNVILKRIGPRIWLPLLTFIWGVVATLQGVIVNDGGKTGLAGFLVVRFFLGLTEGGLFPGVVFYCEYYSPPLLQRPENSNAIVTVPAKVKLLPRLGEGRRPAVASLL
ncbi:hypothetical protein LTR95_005795 [Oleoguttula sp. CCFEE 5521]